MRPRTYSHSGVVTPQGLLLGLVAGLAGGLVLGAVYGFIIFINPFIYVSVLATVAFGVAMGFLVAKTMKAGKVRNAFAVAAVALLAAAFAHAVGWLVWLAKFMEDVEDFEAVYLLDPEVLFLLIAEINELGPWSIRNSEPVSGWFLWAIWGLEALIVLGGATGYAYLTAAEGVFCEPCGRWCSDDQVLLVLSAAPEHETTRLKAFEGDLDAIEQLPPPEAADSRYVTVKVARCEHCGKTNTLSLVEVQHTVNSKGEDEQSETVHLDHALISKEQLERLERHAAAQMEEGDDFDDDEETFEVADGAA